MVLKKTDCCWTEVLSTWWSLPLPPSVRDVGKQLLLGDQVPGQVHPVLQLPHVPGRLEFGLNDPLPLPPEILYRNLLVSKARFPQFQSRTLG